MHVTRVSRCAQPVVRIIEQLKASHSEIQKNLLQFRSGLKHEVHEYLNAKEYIEVDLPVLTSTVLDGADPLFQVKHWDPCFKNDRGCIPFNLPVTLRSSGQAHIEALACGFRKVYSMGPCFKAGLTTGKDLNEFCLLECEESFVSGEQGLQYLINEAHSFLRLCFEYTIKSNASTDNKNVTDFILGMNEKLRKPPVLVKYDDALNLLSSEPQTRLYFSSIPHGFNLTTLRTAQRCLSEAHDNNLLYITHLPSHLVHFNTAQVDGTEDLSLSFNILLPDNFIIGHGAVKDPSYSSVLRKLRDMKAETYHQWYLDARHWGTAPSGGFQILFDSLMQFLRGSPTISPIVPFPRRYKNCSM